MTLEQDFDMLRDELLGYTSSLAALERIHTALVDHQRFLREQAAEVERLQRDLKAAHGATIDTATKLHDAEAEVERLRDIEMKYDILDRDVKERWTPEVERLRAGIERMTRWLEKRTAERDAAHAEVERLRGELVEASAEIVQGVAEVERWRAALQTIQELAATESLRVFHTIASDALAKEDA